MFKKYLFNSFPERCIIFIEGEEKPSPKRKDGIKMKMNNDSLVKIVKDQCDSIVRVLERHAEETTCKAEMKSYKMMSLGKLRGIVDMTIRIYASEFVNDDSAYWEKVSELRAYEDDIDTKLTEIYTKWYEEYLNND